MHRTDHWVAATVAAIAISGCGQSTPTDQLSAARNAASEGNYEAAAQLYERVAGNSNATHSQRYRARRDGVLPSGLTGGEELARAALEQFLEHHADEVDLDTLLKLGRDLANAQWPQAATVSLEAALERFPDDKPKIDQLGLHLAQLAKNDANATRLLKALGYVGGN